MPSHQLWGLDKMPCPEHLCFQLLGMPGVQVIPNSRWEGAFEVQSSVPRRAHGSESRPSKGSPMIRTGSLGGRKNTALEIADLGSNSALPRTSSVSLGISLPLSAPQYVHTSFTRLCGP